MDTSFRFTVPGDLTPEARIRQRHHEASGHREAPCGPGEFGPMPSDNAKPAPPATAGVRALAQAVFYGSPAEWADTKPTNPKDGAATTKLDLSLFPTSAVAYGALAFVEGDQKYGGFNWRVAGVRASIYFAALQRHMAKWWNGEECDPVSQVPHLANALACIAVLIDSTEQGCLNDDRPPAQSSELYDRFQAVVAHLHERFPRQAERHQEQS